MKKYMCNRNGTQKKEPASFKFMPTRVKCRIVAAFLVLMTTSLLADSEYYVPRDNWAESLAASRKAIQKPGTNKEHAWTLWLEIEKHYPVECDWMLQDMGVGENGNSDVVLEWLSDPDPSAINKMLDNISAKIKVSPKATPVELVAALKKYQQKAKSRRQRRLKIVYEKAPKIVYVKRYNFLGSLYAYTEGLSDTQYEQDRYFTPGSALCLLTVRPEGINQEVLIDSKQGVIRDPDVSYDGKRILFAWKKSDREDDYHLYEMNVDTREIKQITYGKEVADYEGIYLPDNDIIFSSSRCVQIVDCWFTEVSNLYKCTGDGKYLRRIGFDQVDTNYPQVLQDGRITYTRWDYNDRGQIFPQPLFVMNADGTAQTEFYGNNSFFPTTILHARPIPGTQKVIAVISGHHTHQRGKLGIIDRTKGRQEASGVQLIAPVRQTDPVKVDTYGQDGDQFQYPYPLSQTQYLTTYVPYHGGLRKYPRSYGIYLTNIDSSRELLTLDLTLGNNISSSQPVPLRPRKKPHLKPSTVDYSQDTGRYYVQDVYFGPGLKGVKRGTIKKLRVVTFESRAAGIRQNRNRGPAGDALISTPVSVGNGSWDVKRVLGEAKVYKDGSAFFEVPARTPVYFQMIDENGYVAQTMRSWSTLQPGETFACAGCHEDKSNVIPTGDKPAEALKAGVQKLSPFYGPPRGFSFPKEIQPILDKHCIKCHNDRENKAPGEVDGQMRAFSLLGDGIEDSWAGRMWSDSYIALTDAAIIRAYKFTRDFYTGDNDGKLTKWISVQSVPDMIDPYTSGSSKSKLMKMLKSGHSKTKLNTEELEKIACWIDLLVPYCGDYTEANIWNDGEIAKYERYQNKRDQLKELGDKNIAELLSDRSKQN